MPTASTRSPPATRATASRLFTAESDTAESIASNSTNADITDATKPADAVKPAEEVEQMSRDELIAYSLNIGGQLKRFLEFERQFEKLEGERSVQSRVNEELKGRADALELRLIDNEKTTINNAQYLRRRQIEVSNVDKKISNNQLKSVMADS